MECGDYFRISPREPGLPRRRRPSVADKVIPLRCAAAPDTDDGSVVDKMAGLAVSAAAGLQTRSVAGLSSAVPKGVGAVSERVSKVSRTVKAARTGTSTLGDFLSPALGRPSSLGSALPSFSVKLKLQLQRPVLFGEGSLRPTFPAHCHETVILKDMEVAFLRSHSALELAAFGWPV